jgi:hypothetical protein
MKAIVKQETEWDDLDIARFMVRHSRCYGMPETATVHDISFMCK